MKMELEFILMKKRRLNVSKSYEYGIYSAQRLYTTVNKI
jgi:hypothetical protein